MLAGKGSSAAIADCSPACPPAEDTKLQLPFKNAHLTSLFHQRQLQALLLHHCQKHSLLLRARGRAKCRNISIIRVIMMIMIIMIIIIIIVIKWMIGK